MSANGWVLEIVKGRDEGRRYPLRPGEQVLGNALGGKAGVDLADQETSPTRRMSPQHALLQLVNGAPVLRDLETPGGTFVNRQRLLPGQARPLREGDLIQLAGVQLALRSAGSAPAPGPVPTPITATTPGIVLRLKDGTTCRTWDDVITLSSQKWSMLRDDLVSGRVADDLRSRGLDRFALPPAPGSPPDEQLDQWLRSLPTSRPARPELDVFPSRLSIRPGADGSVSRVSLRISNVGHGLLRSRVRVEPPGTNWVRSAQIGPSIATVDQTDLLLDIETPALGSFPQKAELVIESDGGAARVAVVLEALANRVADSIHAATPSHSSRSALSDLFIPTLARVGTFPRLFVFSTVFAVLRVVVGVCGSWTFGDVLTSEVPNLAGVALVLAAALGSFGGILAHRARSIRELPTCAMAGAGFGVLLACLLVAASRTVDPVLGGWSSSLLASGSFWGILGALLGAATIRLVPPTA